MAELGITQAELSRTIGVSSAAIAQFFGNKQEESRFWPEIVAALGGVPPRVSDPRGYSDEDLDEYRRVIAQGWHRLTESERKAVADLVRALTASRSRG